MGWEPGYAEYLITLATVGGYLFIPTFIGLVISQEFEKRKKRT